MNLIQFCQQVNGDLRIDWDRHKKRWRVRIVGAGYKLASVVTQNPDGTTVTVTYFATHYKEFITTDEIADSALHIFVKTIRGAKMRLHGKTFHVPVDLGPPSLVMSPLITDEGFVVQDVMDEPISSDDLAKYLDDNPPPFLIAKGKLSPEVYSSIIGNGPSPEWLEDFKKSMEKPTTAQEIKALAEAYPPISNDPNAKLFKELLNLPDDPELMKPFLEQLIKKPPVKFPATGSPHVKINVNVGSAVKGLKKVAKAAKAAGEAIEKLHPKKPVKVDPFF